MKAKIRETWDNERKIMEELEEEATEDNATEPFGWTKELSESDEPPPPCDTLGKRHKWRGGNVCTVCGSERKTTQTSATPRRRKDAGLAPLLGMGWGFAGMTIAARSDRLAGVGNVMQVQSPMAGPRLDNVLKRTPVYKFLTSGTTGVVSDLVPLLAPPLLVGLATSSERMAKAMRPMLVAIMLPIILESSKAQNEGNQLLQEMNNITSEQLNQATNLIDQILGIKGDDNSTE